ncbi:hypothetical protein GS597_08425 [Synechococcales cyanobacterium C]|uniref:DUF2281 domain-containing protein n=1 Tax=Petrachloros mirabilis ULC683 TaxID=2781853 RepID=A0A8K1ZZF9_9CYAN|nr:DUF2281 domain-containing protein [Petrachloros mirabilis]NCJ06532.1 hypothetical protein [Petrachloros mirabilis ULC683]
MESTVERQRLLETVSALPEEALAELASFLDYLRYKSAPRTEANNQSANFLLAIAGLGHSGQPDVSERDEEILRNEIDSVHGWSSRSSNVV